MKKFLFTIAATVLVAMGLQAQPDVKVETGVVAFNQQDFTAAMKALDVALVDPSLLKEKNKPRAFYYRAQTRFMLTQQMMREMATKAQKKDTTGLEKMGRDMLNNLKLCFVDFRKAKEFDTESKYVKEIESGNKTVRQIANMLVDQTLNAIEDEKEKGTAKAEDLKEVKVLIAPLVDEMINVDPDNYLSYDMRAQMNVVVGDSASAISDYEMAIKKFREKPPVDPDMVFAYTYYKLANLYQGKKDLSKALQMLNDGKGVVDTELKRLEAKKQYYHDTIWAKFVDRHDKIQNALFTGELNILLQSPDKLNEALAKFETAVANDPRNYSMHVAYASLLEKVDSVKSVVMYNKAIVIDPKKTVAYYNFGVFYNAKAKDYQDQANETEDEAKNKNLQALRDMNFNIAKPLFEKALEMDPKNLGAVMALKQIATFLMNDADFMKYNELEKKLKAGQ